jgi:hypothetical protein
MNHLLPMAKRADTLSHSLVQQSDRRGRDMEAVTRPRAT